MYIGLYNFTVKIRSETKLSDLVKTPLENAFLTLAVPHGLDHCIGNTKKKHEFLNDTHPAMKTLIDVLDLGGFDVINRVQEFYNS
jgi:hypothetical protein